MSTNALPQSAYIFSYSTDGASALLPRDNAHQAAFLTPEDTQAFVDFLYRNGVMATPPAATD